MYFDRYTLNHVQINPNLTSMIARPCAPAFLTLILVLLEGYCAGVIGLGISGMTIRYIAGGGVVDWVLLEKGYKVMRNVGKGWP